VFLLAIIFITLSLGVFINIIKITAEGIPDATGYLESQELKEKVLSAYWDIDNLYAYYISEENIKNGNTIEESDLNYYKEELIYNSEFINEIYEGNATIDEIIKDPRFLEEYSDEIQMEKDKIISNDVLSFNRIQSKIKGIRGLNYNIEINGLISTFPELKTLESIQKNKVLLESKNGIITSTIKRIEEDMNYGEVYNPNYKLSLSFDDDDINKQISLYESKRLQFETQLIILSLLMLGSIICVIIACIGTGHKRNKEGINLLKIDKLYLDLHFLGVAFCELGILFLMEVLYSQNLLSNFLILLGVGIGVGLGFNFFLSLIRIIKDHSVLKHLLFWKLIKKVKNGIGNIYKGIGSYYKKTIKGSSFVKRFIIYTGVVVVLSLALFIPYVGIVSVGLIAFILYKETKKVKKLDLIKEGVDKIKEGQIDYKINDIDGGLGELAEGINAIGDGINEVVSKEVKSERLKTELITNVSHDIRTPLTSIITSIDLLKNGNLNAEEKEKYLNILENKAQRLKILTDDLFEAAKTASGNIEVNLKDVDLEMLLTQGLGEMEKELVDSGLEFITKYPKELLIVKADGQLLWRAIENLISNTLKYAQNNSRIYIDVDKDDKSKQGCIIIKNISEMPLNIPPEELLERFKRGDETRNSEGSGLGLAIAKDLMEIQGGKLKIEIDGDLFKVMLVLPLV
jgi:signal transduction histidine kinase